MNTLSIWLLGIAGLQANPTAETAAAEAGTRFVQLLATGEFGVAAARIHPQLARTLNATSLEMSWASHGRNFGDFRGVAKASASLHHGQMVVELTCQWERGSRDVTLYLSEDHQVIGMMWAPLTTPLPDMGSLPTARSDAAREVEVTIGSQPWRLPATLSLPRVGEVKAAVVVVSDIGPQDRDGSVGANRPFFELTQGLAAKGIAALRYDKRTRQYAQELKELETTVGDEVITDALTAVAALRNREETRNVPIYLLGHGRGATLAPEIAEADGKIAGVILLAGIARSIEDALADEIEYVAEIYTKTDGAEEWNSIREQVQALRTQTLEPRAMLLGEKASFWYDLSRRDADVATRKAAALPGRLLIVQGGRDFTATEEDFHLWKSALAGHADATFQLFSDLNHLFAKGQGKATPMEHRIPKPFDPRVIELIANWCMRVPLGGAKPPGS